MIDLLIIFNFTRYSDRFRNWRNMKICQISSCMNAFIQETSRYRALTFQSQVSFTSGKSRQGWYQSKRFVSRQTKYCITSELSYFLAPLLHGVARVVFLRRRKKRRRKTSRRFLCRSRRRPLSFPLQGGA